MSISISYHADNPKIIINFTTKNQIHIVEKNDINQGVTLYFSREQIEELYWKIGKMLYEPKTEEPCDETATREPALIVGSG